MLDPTPFPPNTDAAEAQGEESAEVAPTFWDKFTVQPTDSRQTAFLKILAAIGLGVAVLVISPLIILGLMVGLAAVA